MGRDNPNRLKILALFLGAIALASFGVAFSRKNVTLIVNGESHTLTTSAMKVRTLLGQAEISLSEADYLEPPGETWLWWGDRVVFERASRTLILADGGVSDLVSVERIPAHLLAQASISLYPGDRLLVEGEEASPDEPVEYREAYTLSIRRAVPIRIEESGRIREFSSAASTLGQALWEQGIRVRNGDYIHPALDTPLDGLEKQGGLDVVLIRSRDYTIRVGGEQIPARSAAGLVGEVLAEAGLPLQGLDYSLPDEHSPAPEDGAIRVVRVREEVIVEQEPVAFESEYQPAPEVEIDQQQILQTGEYGLMARRLRVVYEDGEEVMRQVEDEWLARPPKNRVVGYGTRVVMHTLDTPDGQIQYWRALRMWATSYHPATTGKTTASGLPLKKGVAAIDRRYIPFHTRMYVPGYGEALAADVGGGVSGRMIDLGYSDEDYVSWHEWVTVYFLWPPPENIVWIIP